MKLNKEILKNSLILMPATLLSSGTFLVDQIFAAQINQEALNLVSILIINKSRTSD